MTRRPPARLVAVLSAAAVTTAVWLCLLGWAAFKVVERWAA